MGAGNRSPLSGRSVLSEQLAPLPALTLDELVEMHTALAIRSQALRDLVNNLRSSDHLTAVRELAIINNSLCTAVAEAAYTLPGGVERIHPNRART